MIAILASLSTYLPFLLSVAGFVITWFGDSKKNLADFQKLIEANKDTGLITVTEHERFQAYHDYLKAKMAEKETSNAPVDQKPPPPAA